MSFAQIIIRLTKKRGGLYRFLKKIYWLPQGLGESFPLVYNCKSWTSSRLVRTMLKVIVSPLHIADYFRRKDFPGREGLALVLIAKDETLYIEEWLNFHLKQGVSHFIIFDNESAQDFHEVLKPYIDAGLVTYRTIRNKIRQFDAYNTAIHDYGHRFKYMGFIDADEFIFLRNNTDGVGGISNLYEFVDEFMKAHPQAGGLGVNWCIFGSSGHITKPEGGVLENYTSREEEDFRDNSHLKTICDPVKVWSFASAHWPIYRRGFRNLNEDGEDISFCNCSPEIHFSKIRINHYFTKSREEFIIKKDVRGDVNNNFRGWSDFDEKDRNEVHDTEILSRV